MRAAPLAARKAVGGACENRENHRNERPLYQNARFFSSLLVRDGDVGNLRTLREQCEKMLVLTPHAYVFLYSETGVTVVPALSAVSTKASPVELYKRSAQRFFEEHLECFIGDRSIHAPTADMLNRLREQADARRALLIQASSDRFPSSPSV